MPLTEFETKALALLTSIDASMKRLVGFATARQAAQKGPEIATDRDLDGPHGNEQVKWDPRDWTGLSFKGLAMNECPAEYLDELARAFDYFAARNDSKGLVDDQGRPKSFYDKRSAGRARGWAKRLRAGWRPPPPPPPMTDDAGAAAFGSADMGSGNFPAAEGFGDESDPFAEPNF